MLRLTITVCSLSFALAQISAQAPTPSDTGLTANPVFQKNCAKCHGKTAEGRHFGGPSLISEKTAMASTDDLSNIITNGKGGSAEVRRQTHVGRDRHTGSANQGAEQEVNRGGRLLRRDSGLGRSA